MAVKQRVSMFVNYLSAYEEGRYCEQPQAMADAIRAQLDAQQAELIASFERAYSLSFFDELVSGQLLNVKNLEALRRCRAVQLILYCCAAQLLQRRFEVVVGAGYSIGTVLSLLMSGAFMPDDMLFVLMTSTPYVHDNWQHFSAGNLRSQVLYNPYDRGFNQHIKQVIGQMGSKVRIKDDRPPFALQIVGTAEDLQSVTECVLSGSEQARLHSTRTIRSDAAHIHPERYESVLSDLRSIEFARGKWRTIVHPEAQILSPADTQRIGAELVFRSIYAPLCMSNVNAALKQIDVPLLLLGSRRVSRFAFFGLGSELLQQPAYFWEDACLSSEQIGPFELPQDSAAW